jgi:hypothetical protein
MSTERADTDVGSNPDSGVSDHVRAVTVTAIAALSGVGAALVSGELTAGLPPADAATQLEPLMVVFALVALQPALLRAVGLLKEDFSAKDFLYLLFMTFSLWFVTWSVLLTSGG